MSLETSEIHTVNTKQCTRNKNYISVDVEREKRMSSGERCSSKNSIGEEHLSVKRILNEKISKQQ